MSWADTSRAAALAALAERMATATVAPVTAGAPWTWNLHDVWLSRVKQSCELAAQSSPSRPTSPRQDMMLRD